MSFYESCYEFIIMRLIRTFFISLFAVLGAMAALVVTICALYFLLSGSEEQSLPSDVKILPDVTGNRKKLSATTPVFLQITLSGEIGKDKLTGKNIEEILIQSRENVLGKDRVKGILLVINSPGGGVIESDTIYRLLKEYKERFNVPIYTFVDGLCASGGYYIACASNKIFASDVSLIGSIGVLSWPPYVNITDTLEKLGMHALVLFAGKGKEAMNPVRHWESGEQDSCQQIIDFYYKSFVNIVASSRSMGAKQIEENLGAKVYPAPLAKEIGLIDANNSSRNQALEELVKSVGISGPYQVIGFETRSWWKKMLQEDSKSFLFGGKIKHEISIPVQSGNPFYYR